MNAYRVLIIESERGWGSKIDETKEFRGENALADAKAFVAQYNSFNTASSAPDWYMRADGPFLIHEGRF